MFAESWSCCAVSLRANFLRVESAVRNGVEGGKARRSMPDLRGSDWLIYLFINLLVNSKTLVKAFLDTGGMKGIS